MSTVTVNLEGLANLKGGISRLKKQVDFAMAGAINDVAYEVMREGRAEMKRVFDRPTPYTINSWRVTDKATRNSLTARVEFSDYLSSAGVGPDQKLKQQFIGGPRRRTATEFMLQNAGMLKRDRYLVPGLGAKLNKYGNISPGQLSQIRSQLKLGNDPASFSSDSARSRRNVARSGNYFWSYGRASTLFRSTHLAQGVWLRKGNAIHPILLSARSPKYRSLMSPREISEAIVKRDMESAFNRRFALAMSTAR